MKKSVPVWEKVTLTLEEAAEYSNIGINKIRSLSNNPRCNWVIYVGKKRLIKRRIKRPPFVVISFYHSIAKM